MSLRWTAAVSVALALGALLLHLAVLAWYGTGDRYADRAGVIVDGRSCALLAGAGETAGPDFRVTGLSDRGHAILVSPELPLGEKRFDRLVVRASGVEGRQIGLLWEDPGRPGSPRMLPLQFTEDGSAEIDPDRIRGTGGHGGSIGFLVEGQGVLAEPVVLHEFRLAVSRPGAARLLGEVWSEWTAFEGWRGHSINFIVGGLRQALVPPTLAVALWVVLSAAVYALFAAVAGRPRALLPFAIVFLIGWFVLDIRWQVDLWRQFPETRAEFATEAPERRWGMRLGDLTKTLDEVRGRLSKGDRLLLVALDDEPDLARYTALSARYYLLPLDVMPAWKQQPGIERVIGRLRAGDHLLFLNPDGPANRPAPGSATPVFRDRHGALYRIER